MPVEKGPYEGSYSPSAYHRDRIDYVTYENLDRFGSAPLGFLITQQPVCTNNFMLGRETYDGLAESTSVSKYEGRNTWSE